MKESLSAIPKQPIFRETFTDEQTTRLNGGVPTAVTYSNGIGTFNGTTSFVSYSKPLNGTYSIRFKFYTYNVAIGAIKMLFDSRLNSGIGTIYDSSGILSISSGTRYINGIAADALSNTTTEIIVTGMSLVGATSLIGRNFLNYAWSNNSIELFEIYDYTLTANEVKNLYEGKRNRPLDLKQTATSIDNYYQGVGVIDNYFSTPHTVISQINDNIEVIVNHSFESLTGSLYEAIGINKYQTTNNGYLLEYGQSTGKLYFSTRNTVLSSATLASAGITINTRVWLKVNRNVTTGDVNFYYSLDTTTVINEVVWIQLGTTVAATSGIFGINTNTIFVGAYKTSIQSEPMKGKTYRATVSNVIGGAPIIDFNPQHTNAPLNSGSFTSLITREVWTLTGTQTFIGNGARPEILNIDGRNGVIANKYNPENLFASSEDLTASVYTAVNINKFVNYFTEDTSNNLHILLQSLLSSETQGTYIIVKCRLKAKGRTKVELRNNAGGGASCFFDLSNGTKYLPDAFCVSTITPSTIGNGYYDITYTYFNSATTYNVHFRLKDAAGNDSYTGDGVSGIYVEKLQLNSVIEKPYVQTFSTIIKSTLVNTAVKPVRQGNVWGMGFNGTSSNLNIGNYDNLLGDITLISWVNIVKYYLTNPRILDNSKLLFYIGLSNRSLRLQSDGVADVGSAINAIKIGSWALCMVTRTSTGVANFYINGVLSGTANQASGTPTASTVNIRTGSTYTGTDGFVNGGMAQIRIIKGILNAQECQQLFDNERHDYNI